MNLYKIHVALSAIGSLVPVYVGLVVGLLVIDGHWMLGTGARGYSLPISPTSSSG